MENQKKINQKSIGECGIRTCDHRISNTENFSNFHWLLPQILLIFLQDFYKHFEILSTRFCNFFYVNYLWVLQIFCSTIKLQKVWIFSIFSLQNFYRHLSIPMCYWICQQFLLAVFISFLDILIHWYVTKHFSNFYLFPLEYLQKSWTTCLLQDSVITFTNWRCKQTVICQKDLQCTEERRLNYRTKRFENPYKLRYWK